MTDEEAVQRFFFMLYGWMALTTLLAIFVGALMWLVGRLLKYNTKIIEDHKELLDITKRLDARIKVLEERISENDFTVDSDGRTVWVNNAYGLLGRLGPNGIDIHIDPREDKDGAHCLDCGPLPPNPWAYFVNKMQEHHNVVVGNEHRPKWCDLG